MIFLFSTGFVVSRKFGYVMSSFSLNSRKYLFIYLFIFLIFALTQRLFSFHEFAGFLLLLKSTFTPWWSDRMQAVISIFFYLLDLLCDQVFWRRFPEVLRRVYILLSLDKIDVCRDIEFEPY